MSNMDWQTSDGVTLKSLRQSAGIGLSVLARKASLSVDQLRQLEDEIGRASCRERVSSPV